MRYRIKTTAKRIYVVDSNDKDVYRASSKEDAANWITAHAGKRPNAFVIAAKLKKMGLGDLGLLPRCPVNSSTGIDYLRHVRDKS